ncbi:MAG: tRNA pseudouridine(55) synthase TruB [Candidatus Woesebacteria bacterium]|jgi:tRNA pseudouridine55 synthase
MLNNNQQKLDEKPFLKKLTKDSKGIILIDKPSACTSHDIVNKVRKITGIRRVGHCGTLDPLATGLLIILIGREFTKQQNKFLKLNKEYLCQAQLGLKTDTYDIDGQVLETANWEKINQITQDKLKSILKSFKDTLEQKVPAFSAVKVKGKKLYQQARKSKVKIENLPTRKIKIYNLELIDLNKNKKKKQCLFKIKVKCSSGTYIRSLINDIGEKLGVGATVIQLRRTKIDQFKVEDAIKI